MKITIREIAGIGDGAGVATWAGPGKRATVEQGTLPDADAAALRKHLNGEISEPLPGPAGVLDGGEDWRGAATATRERYMLALHQVVQVVGLVPDWGTLDE